MPLIDKEKDIIFELAVRLYDDENKKRFLGEEKQESYYKNVNQAEGYELQEFDFDTPVEIKAILESFFKEKNLPMEYVVPVMVSMLKLRENVEKEDVLLETIYNF